MKNALLSIVELVPMLRSVVTRHYNPYRGGSHGSRLKDFRSNLRGAVYGNGTTPISCMVTGFSVGDDEVADEDIPAAHILPSSTSTEIADILEMTLGDIQATRNGLFLCKRIEESFDELGLSFVPIDILHPNEYKMVIWKDDYKKRFVIKGSSRAIGLYDGLPLNLGNLIPFRRALSYQAFLAYDNLSISEVAKLQQSKPEYFGTPPKSSGLNNLLMAKIKNGEEFTTTRKVDATLMTAIKEEGYCSDEDC